MPGPQEFLVIAVVALLVFGPDRLPEVARNAARLLARFRAETRRSVDELRRAADVEDLDRELRGLGRELRETRTSMTRDLKDVTRDPRLGTGRRVGVGDRSVVRADDDPPPVDPEAT